MTINKKFNSPAKRTVSYRYWTGGEVYIIGLGQTYGEIYLTEITLNFQNLLKSDIDRTLSNPQLSKFTQE